MIITSVVHYNKLDVSVLSILFLKDTTNIQYSSNGVIKTPWSKGTFSISLVTSHAVVSRGKNQIVF
jgi:hypothetical protein